MVIPATTSPSPRPPPSVKPLPAKLRRQSTFERQPQSPPSLPQPTTPTLLSLARSNSRSQSTPPQHTVTPSTSFGESIFQSLSFGPFASGPSKQTGPSSHRSPPPRSSTMLSNVLEAPTQLESYAEAGPETHHPPSSYNSGHSFAPSRRRVTSPDTTHPFAPARTTSPGPEDAYAPPTSRIATSSPRSPPLAFGDSHPRKSRSTLRLSRLRPGSGRDDMGTESVPEMFEEIDRPGSAREGGAYRPVSTRRPGSAGGEMARKGSAYRGPVGEGDGTSAGAESDRNGTVSARHAPVVGSRTRGMRVRASSELSRPAVPMSTSLHETEGIPPPRTQRSELRPPLPVSSSGSSGLGSVPLSPGVQSTWSKQSGESALADDSDVDADAPTTPSLTAGNSRTASNSNSSVNQSVSHNHQSQIPPTTPTPSFLMLGLDPLDRTQAREDADRRRREEAARELEERAQHAKFFVRKGPAKERCHSYPPSEAPYPLSYTPRVLNSHTVDVDLSWQMISSLTYHAFATPPAKVLDLGCGTGHWILRAAREWTETEFVGFDLVPIQPSLTRVTGKSGGSIAGNSYSNLRLDERIRWVHGNFLKKLPFGDAEFDMVRCRRIARGVPESKWDGLYEEIVRVMKPGAAFEHVEEDIVFPTEIPNKSSQSPLAVYPTPSPSYASSNPPYLSSTSLPNGARGSIPVVRPPDQYRRSPSTSFSSAFDSPVEGRHNIPSVSSAASNASIMSASNSLAPLRTGSISLANPAATLVVPGSASGAPSPDVGPTFGKDARESGDSAERGPKLAQNQDISFYDPRVHTRLQELFVSMHDARWINLKPLSLIPRLIQEHLTGMISSPAFNINMPPRPRDAPSPSRVADANAIMRVSGDAVHQLMKSRAEDEGRNADLSVLVPQPGDEEVAQYVSFDFLRMGSVSRTRKALVMPVHAFEFHLGSLPMHLSCAANEIVGCKEAMWEHLKAQDPQFDRREYDAMIRQYQTDIQDRIGLSSKLREKLHWGPPESDFMRTADQRAFEDNYAQAIALDQTNPETASRPPGLMRCLRAFVAWKPTE